MIFISKSENFEELMVGSVNEKKYVRSQIRTHDLGNQKKIKSLKFEFFGFFDIIFGVFGVKESNWLSFNFIEPV